MFSIGDRVYILVGRYAGTKGEVIRSFDFGGYDIQLDGHLSPLWYYEDELGKTYG